MAKPKSGPKDVDEASRGSSPSRNVPGGPGHSFAQMPIPGPSSPGQPTSMKKALAKKRVPGGDVTGNPGLVR